MRNIRSIIIAIVFGILPFTVFPGESGRVHFALLGDSMTWIGGDSCQNATGWSHYLRQSGIADRIDVYARSGATWTNTPDTRPDTEFYTEVLHDDNVIYNQVLRLIAAAKADPSATPDCIVILAGTNDAWFSSRRPNLFMDNDQRLTINDKLTTPQPHNLTTPQLPTTLYSSVTYICDLLQDAFPSSRLIIVTPLLMSKVTPDTIHRVSDIIESAAKSRNCAVIRTDIDLMKKLCSAETSDNTQSDNTRSDNILGDNTYKDFLLQYTSDGVHTNPAGARLLADFLLPFLSN